MNSFCFRSILIVLLALSPLIVFSYFTPDSAEIIPYGGAGEVSGSAFYIKTDNGGMLIDCGLFYPDAIHLNYGEDVVYTAKRNAVVPVPPDKVDAIILTHAHLDHIGRIPLMVKNGYRDPIYATPLTKELSMVMFEMMLPNTTVGEETYIRSERSDVVHSNHACIWATRIRNPVHIQKDRSKLGAEGLRVCNHCLEYELKQIEELFLIVDYNLRFTPLRGTSAYFLDAKHIPGSSSIYLEINLHSGKRTVLFSGDIGAGIDNIIKGDPVTPESVDYLFLESTYGGYTRNVPVDPYNEFYRDINNALQNNRRVWIPAFVLDRTQKILYTIRKGQQSGTLPPGIAIKVLSPTAKKVNVVYDDYYEYRPEFVDETWTMYPKRAAHKSKRPFIMTTPAYLDGLEFYYPVIRDLLMDHRTTVMIVGYQDPRSLTGRLLDLTRDRRLRLGDKTIQVRANIKRYGVFSGHADAAGLVNYIERSNVRETVFLVHGNKDNLESLHKYLTNETNYSVMIPDLGVPIIIE